MKRTLIAIPLLLAACQSGEPAPSTSETRISGDGDGRSYSVAAGTTLELELAANPSTGYEWQIGSVDTTIVAPRGAEFEPNEAARSGADGAGGTQTWRFAARAPGSTRLVMLYRRPWEPPTAHTDTFAVNVTVTQRGR